MVRMIPNEMETEHSIGAVISTNRQYLQRAQGIKLSLKKVEVMEMLYIFSM